MEKETLQLFRKKFETFQTLCREMGREKALEKMFAGYPERQKETMGEYIDNSTLAEGFTRAIAFYRQIGMEMKVVDISNNGKDAVIEIQNICPALPLAKEFGFEKPCDLICEMDIEATKKAFPDITGEILCRQVQGASVCIFKYERKAKKERVTDGAGQLT